MGWRFCGLGWAVACCLAGAVGKGAEGADPDGRGHVVVGFNLKSLTNADVKDVSAATELWVREIAKRSGLRAEARVFRNDGELRGAFREGTVDMVSGTTLDYLRTLRHTKAEVAYGGLAGGKATRRYLVLVPVASAYRHVPDLRGKRLAAKREEELALLYLNTFLLRSGQEEAGRFFRDIVEKRTWSQAALATFFGRADACLVTDGAFKTMVALNPQVGERLRVLASSPELVETLAFFRLEYDGETKRKIRRAVSGLASSQYGRQLLLLFRLDDVVALQESDLRTTRALVEEYWALRRGQDGVAGE